MGYTIGRRLTKEFVLNEAKKYKSRSEFQQRDGSCYVTARLGGFLDEACSHMAKISFSIPQTMCKLILDALLGESGEYNTRQIIKPYEIDVYYPKFKLAVEYFGKGWHEKEEAVARDEVKRKLCQESGISLLVIRENSRRYEEDVKNQILDNVNFIKSVTGVSFSEGDLSVIDCSSCYGVGYYYRAAFDEKEFVDKINSCKNLSEFKGKYPREYKVIRKLKKFSLLDGIRMRPSKPPPTDEEVVAKCKELAVSYSDFIKNHYGLYLKCHRRGILETATSHMVKKKRTFKEEEICELAKKYVRRVDFKNAHNNAYRQAIKLGIIAKLFPTVWNIDKGARRYLVPKEKIISDAKKCKNRTQLKRKYFASYRSAKKLGLLDCLFKKGEK